MDSRQVKPGDLFIAVKGLTVDGRVYMEEAIGKGAVAVLTERKSVGHMAARFFSHPSKAMPVMGITGTSGKTSVSHFIAEIMSYCKRACGIIGTLGAGIFTEKKTFEKIKMEDGTIVSQIPHDYTTPDAIAVQRTLAAFCQQKVSAVAMEVTSHALDQHRVAGVEFDTVIFTNLGRDHLDYHADMTAYGQIKKKLFTEFQWKHAIINVDDAFGKQLFTELKRLDKEGRVLGYSCDIPPNPPMKGGEAILCVRSVVLNNHGIRATVQTPWDAGELQCNILGRFNLSNILAAIAAVCLQGIPLKVVLEAIKMIHTVPGRMMRFGGNSRQPLVIVDYAHKPDALAAVLEALRAHCKGQLWCVIGCGGDRDRGKRPLMAAIGEGLSDHLYLTQDNPRTEDPKQIMTEMVQGLKNPHKTVIEHDRRTAIELAIKNAKIDDIVLIAGKGHETYQIIGTEKIPFSDTLIVEAALEQRKT